MSRGAGPAVVLALAAAVLAAPAGADERRFRISVGGGVALVPIDWGTTSTWEEHRETAELEAAYEAGPGPALEGGLVVRVSRRFGLRASVGWSRRDVDATIDARIPHPFHFERPRSLEGKVSGLEYRELASHFDLEWRPLVGRTEVAVFGGVCLARVEADVVEQAEYDEEYPFDEVTYSSAVTERARSDAGVGWSAGAAVSHALGGRFEIALQARYTRARVELVLANGDVAPLDAGGLQVTAAFRLAF